jgi:ATP-dependent Clp protease protease subunit
VLFLTQNLDDETTNQLIGVLLYLGSEDKECDIFLYVNSNGGSVSCGLSLVDTMNHIKTDVNTVNVGTAESIASLVMASGRKGGRLALPHARFRIHQPEGCATGQATEVLTESKEVVRIRRTIGYLYAEFTGQSLDCIALGLDRDEFLDATQAFAYGLIDCVRNEHRSSRISFKKCFFLIFSRRN